MFHGKSELDTSKKKKYALNDKTTWCIVLVCYSQVH